MATNSVVCKIITEKQVKISLLNVQRNHITIAYTIFFFENIKSTLKAGLYAIKAESRKKKSCVEEEKAASFRCLSSAVITPLIDPLVFDSSVALASDQRTDKKFSFARRRLGYYVLYANKLHTAQN